MPMDKTKSVKMHCNDLDISTFAKKLSDTVRDKRTLLANMFIEGILCDGANRSVRIHVLKSDGNGRPQVGMLVKEICSSTLDYCIPRKQILAALKDYKDTRSLSKIDALSKEAKVMFTDIGNSGEGGELLLFILTESILMYPQALSKMAIKTSSKMHFHGLDGVYISCSGDANGLRLHYGESKLHKDPGDAIRSAVDSISKMLNDQGFIGESRRDYYLLNTLVDLGSEKLEDALKGFLDPNDQRYRASEVCAVLLAGHNLADYPVVRAGEGMPQLVVDIARKHISVLESAAAKCEIAKFHIDLFLIPFPDVEEFRSSLLKELGLKC